MPKNRKLNATELLTALQKQETRSRAAISGWNTRIRRQIARRATQELAALQTANLAHEICQNENVERTRLVQNYELESRNIEAARQCQICLEQYGTQHPIFPSVCPCKARLCVECAEAAFANNQPRCPFCAQDLETTQLLHTICNLRMAENLLNQDEAAHIMQCEWQLARYALNLVPEPAISDSDDDPLMAPHLNNHVWAIQSDEESDDGSTSNNTTSSHSSDSQSSWWQEGYDLATHNSSTSSEASSGGIIFSTI